jgi:hypothetical protein
MVKRRRSIVYKTVLLKKTEAGCNSFASRKPVKNLAELANGPTTYMRWQEKGIYFCPVRQSAVAMATEVTRSYISAGKISQARN